MRDVGGGGGVGKKVPLVLGIRIDPNFRNLYKEERGDDTLNGLFTLFKRFYRSFCLLSRPQSRFSSVTKVLSN